MRTANRMLALVLAAALPACSRSSAPRFDTAKADKGRIVAKVTATGTLSALVTVQVGSQVSGRIQELLVDFNSVVKKGQVIARIDPQFFNAALEQARANYLAAESNLKKSRVQAVQADRDLGRSQELFDRKLIAQADLDTARSTSESAHATVDASASGLEQARAQLNQAQVNLAYTTITSPIDGVVISRSVDVGQTVAASFQSPTLFIIAEDLRKMQVDTSVSEADVGRLTAGMKASFLVDAFPGERFDGAVRQIRNAAQTVQNVVTYDAVIDVANPELKLRPGMTANCTFVWAEKEEVVRLPNSALRFRLDPALVRASRPEGSGGARAAEKGERGERPASPPEGGRTLWVLSDGRPRAVPVVTGITDGTFTELVSGTVQPGDALITDASGGAAAGAGGGSGGGGAPRMPRLF